MKPAALQADFTSYRPVPSRKVLILSFEVPLESQEHTFKVLGYPTPGESTWVAIARLALTTAKAEGATAPNTNTQAPERSEPEKRHFRDMPRSQQAGIKCQDRDFFGWLTYHEKFQDAVQACDTSASNAEVADMTLKLALGITSKKELDAPGPAQDEWLKMLASFDNRAYTRG